MNCERERSSPTASRLYVSPVHIVSRPGTNPGGIFGTDSASTLRWLLAFWPSGSFGRRSPSITRSSSFDLSFDFTGWYQWISAYFWVVRSRKLSVSTAFPNATLVARVGTLDQVQRS